MTGRKYSKYYEGYDGTKLAVTFWLPDGQTEAQPVILTAGRDGRNTLTEVMGEAIAAFNEAGFIMAFLETRGTGASYGYNEGFFDRRDVRDAAAVIDQIGEESFCSGKVGMMGGSNMGAIQELAAAEHPEHLAAIAPCDCNPDMYYQNFPNGASTLPQGIELPPFSPEPVDEDQDLIMLQEALEEQKRNSGFLGQYRPNMWRDTRNQELGYAPNQELPVWERMEELRFSPVASYLSASWYDPGVTGALLAYKYWDSRLVIGPWRHMEMYNSLDTGLPGSRYNWLEAHISFFNKQLKGTANGSDQMPRIAYYTRNEASGREWKRSADWPVDGQVFTELYFSREPSGIIQSGYDGTMYPEQPRDPGTISYQVRTDIKFMQYGRLDRRVEEQFGTEAEKCITFVSDYLPEQMELTGNPVVELFVKSTHPDGNFIAVLEEVESDGKSSFITEGAIRASHGALSEDPAWDALGLPYHSGMQKDAIELNEEEPIQLAFNMEAVSYLVKKESRLRVSIFCGAEGTFDQPEGFPDEMPTVTLMTGEEYPSLIRLPVVLPDVNEFHTKICRKSGQAWEDTEAVIYTYKRAVYIQIAEQWIEFPCCQCYQDAKGAMIYETQEFIVAKKTSGREVSISLSGDTYRAEACSLQPERFVFEHYNRAAKRYRAIGEDAYQRAVIKPDCEDIYVASVPVNRGIKHAPNLEPGSMKDLYVNIAYPQGYENSGWLYPCMIGIHGYGGTHRTFPDLTRELLEAGYAVVSVDYRNSPPGIWPQPGDDVKGAIRHIKAHAEQYHIDIERIGVIGGSAGGHLSAMIAATNGDPDKEGVIGRNNEYDSSVRAAAIYYPWTDIFSFGIDNMMKYPGQPEKMLLSDGPYAPLASEIGFSGPGKGIQELKKHLFDEDQYYKEYIDRAADASPVNHVSAESAPAIIVHGSFEYGVQIPMAQSIRFFDRMTEKGVKAILACNNNGPYGEDPEVKAAVLEFIKNRV